MHDWDDVVAAPKKWHGDKAKAFEAIIYQNQIASRMLQGRRSGAKSNQVFIRLIEGVSVRHFECTSVANS